MPLFIILRLNVYVWNGIIDLSNSLLFII